ncbi:hypothetical protein P9112_009634 [Eukaryota sp. TZLM1-RC]
MNTHCSKYLIIDTDAGVDDAQALISALRLQHSYTILGITTVEGNCPRHHVDTNVRRVVKACNSTVPVYPGCSSHVVELRKPHQASYVHGVDGLGDVDWSTELEGTLESVFPLQTKKAAVFLSESVAKYKDQLDIVALGPLTNIHVALKLDDSIISNIGKVFIMSGSLSGTGNVTKNSEFNCFTDPEAAHECFRLLPKIELITWDLTLSSTVNWDFYNILCKQDSISSRFFKLISAKTAQFVSTELNCGWTLPDPLCMLVCLFPEVVKKSSSTRVKVLLHGVNRGRTIPFHQWEEFNDNELDLMWEGEGEREGEREGVEMNVNNVEEVDMILIEKLLADSLI